MKAGMKDIGELALEVKRRTEAKADYLRQTNTLSMTVVEPEQALVEANQSGRVVSVDGGRHVALAEWYENGMRRSEPEPGTGRSNGKTKRQRLSEGIPQIIVPGKGDSPDMQFPLNEWAHDQLGTYLGIPSAYYDTLRHDDPSLLAENVTRRAQSFTDSDVRLVRTLDGVGRAFLGNGYRPLDNWGLMKAIMPLFNQEGDTRLPGGKILRALRGPDGNLLKVSYESMNITDRNLYIKIVAPNMLVDLAPDTKLKVGQTVAAGVLIKNSEVGSGKIGVYPFYEILQCTNGAYITEWGKDRRHVGSKRGADIDYVGNEDKIFSDEARQLQDEALFVSLRDVVRSVFTQQTFEQMLEPLRNSMGIKIDNPAAAVDTFGTMTGLGDADKEAVLSYLMAGEFYGPGGHPSIYDVSQATTRYSQDVESYDRATELERIGGDLINSSAAIWKDISEAVGVKRRRKAA